MGTLNLRTDNDARYADNASKPDVKEHQQAHDGLARLANMFDVDAIPSDGDTWIFDVASHAYVPGAVTAGDGTPATPATTLQNAAPGSVFRIVYGSGWPSSRPSSRTDIYFDLTGAPANTPNPSWLAPGDGAPGQRDTEFDSRLDKLEATPPGSTTWETLNHPNTFPPSDHTHPAGQISDSTTVGRAVLTAADKTAARAAIGAGTGDGTSNVAIGSGATQAAPGNHSHPASVIVFTPVDNLTATDVQAAIRQAATMGPAAATGTPGDNTVTAAKIVDGTIGLVELAPAVLNAFPRTDLAQTLTPAQQTQAKANLGVVDGSVGVQRANASAATRGFPTTTPLDIFDDRGTGVPPTWYVPGLDVLLSAV